MAIYSAHTYAVFDKRTDTFYQCGLGRSIFVRTKIPTSIFTTKEQADKHLDHVIKQWHVMESKYQHYVELGKENINQLDNTPIDVGLDGHFSSKRIRDAKSYAKKDLDKCQKKLALVREYTSRAGCWAEIRAVMMDF